MTNADREEAVQDRIGESINDIFEDEVIVGVTAETNAGDWMVDEFEIENYDWGPAGCRANFTFAASGTQSEDHSPCGDHINGNGTAVIDSEGRVIYENLHAEIDHSGDDNGSRADRD